MTPPFLCENIEGQNVDLDGSGSTDGDGESDTLSFQWAFSEDALEFLSGSRTDSSVRVAFSSTRTVEIELEVTDENGESSKRNRALGLIRTTATPCGQGCEDHEICVAVSGSDICIDDVTCQLDSDCGDCLRCGSDGTGTLRCLPSN
jgi:hypothetical protein